MKKTMKLKLMLVVATVTLLAPSSTYAWGSCTSMWNCVGASCFVSRFADCIGGTIVNFMNFF